MSSFMGIQYMPSSAQVDLQSQLVGGLSATQQPGRQVKNQAWKGFEAELTPEQHAAQQKWYLEKLEGAPPSVWKADKQAFVASLSPQEQADRSTAMADTKTFLGSLSQQQVSLRNQLVAARDASLLQSVGQLGGANPGGLNVQA